jgi:hypothetical protein
MKPERAKMPGSIVGDIVLLKLCRVNFAGMLIPADKPLTEAFRASEGLNAPRIQVAVFVSFHAPRRFAIINA